jgi:hypothetical protein
MKPLGRQITLLPLSVTLLLVLANTALAGGGHWGG